MEYRVIESYWNYRVVESFDRTEFFIAEVYYDPNHPHSWWASSLAYRMGADDGDGYTALKDTLQAMLGAFDKPTLRVVEGDRLEEIGTTV